MLPNFVNARAFGSQIKYRTAAGYLSKEAGLSARREGGIERRIQAEQSAYRHAGISLPHHTYEQMRVGLAVGRNDIEAGDRIYCNFSGPGRPEHAMLAISPTLAIEAPTPGQRVHITSIPLGHIEIRRSVGSRE